MDKQVNSYLLLFKFKNKFLICTYSFEKFDNIYNFYLTTVHEIGHALGYIGHNGNALSVMYPSYKHHGDKDLFTKFDKEVMQQIYPDVGENGKDICRNTISIINLFFFFVFSKLI